MLQETVRGSGLIASMATPAVLLLATAMLILSTNQRLQSIIARLQELGPRFGGPGGFPTPSPPAESPGAAAESREVAVADRPELLSLVHRQVRRERMAHRALLFFYLAGSLFILLVFLIGLSGMEILDSTWAVMLSGLAGSALLLVGIAHLAVETWMGISATDEQLRRFTAGHEQVSR